MASISSLGIGSGLDIGGLVSSLVSAEGAGKSARLDRREIDFQAKLSIIGSVKSALKDFQGSYSGLKLTSNFKSYTASSSDTAAFTATAKNGAEETSYSLAVTQIAKAHKLKTIEFAEKDTSIGTGSLQFVQGDGTTTDVTITDGSLEGIRDAINSADFGVDASIVFNGTGYVMSLASDLGTDKAITSIDATTVPANTLDSFEYGATADDPAVDMTDIQAAQAASFTVNGVGITSQTNTVTNIIDNVTIELKAGDGGIANETLTIGRNTSTVEAAVAEFVEGYNSLISGLNSATFYDSDSEESGILIGDPTVRGIVTQMRNMLNNTTGNASTEFNSFASIGILTTRDGTLEFDSSKLASALKSKPDEVQELLAGGGASIAALDTEIVSITDNIGAGSYQLDVTAVPERAAHESSVSPIGSFNFDYTGSDTRFSMLIDGVASTADITIPAIDYTGATDLESGKNIAAAIQAAINNDATANSLGYSSIVTFEESSVDPGKYSYKIASEKYGSASSVEVEPTVGGDFATLTKIASTGGTAAVGVSGAGTIAGQAASFVGNRVTGSGLYAGFVLDITGGGTGIRTVNVTEGNISKLDVLINSFLDSDGLLDAKADGLGASIEIINEQRAALALRLESLESRLIKQFSAMDSLVAQLNSTSSFLTNQLEQVSKIGQK